MRRDRARPFLERLGDEALAARAAGGDDAAFAVLVRRHAVGLRGVATAIAGEAGADDAVQRTLIAAHRAVVTRGERLTDPGAWLRTVCRRAAVDQVRAAARAGTAAELDDTVAAPVGELEAREHARRVLAALRDLPAGQRAALVQVELEGRSYGETAARLGRSEASVRQLLHRARVRVRATAAGVVPPSLARWSTLGAGDEPVALVKGAVLAVGVTLAAGGTVAGVHVARRATAPAAPAAATAPAPSAAAPAPAPRVSAPAAAAAASSSSSPPGAATDRRAPRRRAGRADVAGRTPVRRARRLAAASRDDDPPAAEQDEAAEDDDPPATPDDSEPVAAEDDTPASEPAADEDPPAVADDDPAATDAPLVEDDPADARP